MKFCLMTAAILSLCTAYGENLIYNGGFELGTDGFALHRIVTRKDRRHLPLELDSANAASGKYALRLTNPDRDYFEFYVSAFHLKPETSYTFTMTAKTDVRNGVPLEALIHDVRWNNKRKNFRIGNEYRTYSFTFNTGKNGGWNVIRLWSFQRTDPDGGWKGNLWLDDLSVVETGKSADCVFAGVAGRQYWMTSGAQDRKPFQLKLQNATAQEYRGTLNVKTRSDPDGGVVAEEKLDIRLKPGEIRTVPLTGSIVPRYGCYTIAVDGNRVCSRRFPFAVIGEHKRVPRDFSRDFCIGINGGLEYRSGYVNRTLIKRNGFHTYNTSPDRKWALLNLAGVRLVREWGNGRLPTDWATAEPENGKYDFSFFDFAMNTLEKNDLVPVHILGGELFRQPYLEKENRSANENPIPAWALPMAERPAELPPYAMQKLRGYIAYPPLRYWKRYLTKLAEHSKGRRHYYEFTNEPNLYVTPEVYVKYLKATCEGLKQGDPDAQVVGFCVTSDFKADSSSWLGNAISAGGLAYCDILSFHPYSMRELGSIQPADKAIKDIFALMKRGSRTLPVWNTELYYLFDTQANGDREQKEQKPEYLLTRLLLDCGEGVAQSMPIADEMMWSETSYLNYRGELIPSPYFVACNTFARLFEAAKPVAKHRLANGVICYVYRKDGKPVAALWNYQKKADVRLDLSRFEVLDLFGNPVKAETKRIDAKPYYLRPGNRTETEFLNACANLKPYLVSPVIPSSTVRRTGDGIVVGLHNNSAEKQRCILGFNGGGYSAKQSVEVLLNPNESRSIAVPCIKPGNGTGKPQVILYDGNLRRLPVAVVENDDMENGTSRKIQSPDGKLSAELSVKVENNRFHLNVNVRDSSDAGVSGTRRPWETDSIELFLDPAPYVLPERFAELYNGKTARAFLTPRDPNPFTLRSEQWKPEDCNWHISPNANGYSVSFECPAEGLPFGFGLKINDAENSRSKAVRSAGWGVKENAHANRLSFGIIRRKTEEKPEKQSDFSLSDGSFENGGKGLRDWQKNYSSKTFPASLADTDDFLNGRKSLKLTASPESMLSVVSRNLPLIPGRTLELTFWAKGQGIQQLDSCLEVWSPAGHRGEHLYIRKKFKLGNDWQFCTLNLPVPENADRYPDINGKTARIKFWLPKSQGAVLVDDIEYRIVP